MHEQAAPVAQNPHPNPCLPSGRLTGGGMAKKQLPSRETLTPTPLPVRRERGLLSCAWRRFVPTSPSQTNVKEGMPYDDPGPAAITTTGKNHDDWLPRPSSVGEQALVFQEGAGDFLRLKLVWSIDLPVQP